MTREQCASLKPGDKVYVTKGCPDSNPYRATIRTAGTGGFLAFIEGGGGIMQEDLHLTADEALAHCQELLVAAIARVEKQIRTAPDRLAKLKARQPVIKE